MKGKHGDQTRGEQETKVIAGGQHRANTAEKNDSIQGDEPHRSDSSRYAQLIEDVRDDLTRFEPFFAAAQDEIDARARLEFARGTRIVPAGLGGAGPLVGAAAVARRAFVPDRRGVTG